MISPAISSLKREHADLKKQVARMSNELTQVRQKEATTLITQKVDQAIREGRLFPSQRDYMIAHYVSDASEFDKFIGMQPKIIQAGQDGTFTGRIGEPKDEILSARELTVCQNLGLPAALAEHSIIAADGTIQRLRKPDRFVEVFAAAKKARLSNNVHVD